MWLYWHLHSIDTLLTFIYTLWKIEPRWKKRTVLNIETKFACYFYLIKGTQDCWIEFLFWLYPKWKESICHIYCPCLNSGIDLFRESYDTTGGKLRWCGQKLGAGEKRSKIAIFPGFNFMTSFSSFQNICIIECSEKDQNCKLQFPQPDYWPRHSPDFRTVFGIMIRPFSICEIGKTWGTNKQINKQTNKNWNF